MRLCSPERSRELDRGGQGQTGLSLIEMLVAVSVLGIALSMLYKSMGSSVRAAVVVERQQSASLLAISLLNARAAVPASGWNESGASAELTWQISTQPLQTPAEFPQATRLHHLRVRIQWPSDRQSGELIVESILPEALPLPGAGS